MDAPSDGRIIAFGLLSAGSAFLGSLIGLSAPLFPSSILSLLFAVAIAPALAVFFLGTLFIRTFGGRSYPSAAAAAAFAGGATAMAGSLVVSGLFLFVGWFLFPAAFAYAGAVMPHLHHRRFQSPRALVLHVVIATAFYIPWIGLTLFQAVDQTAEMAGAREGAGWMENFPSAMVLVAIYGLVIITALGATRSQRTGLSR